MTTAWTPEETDLLRSVYPTAPWWVVATLLAPRSKHRIEKQASKLQIKRELHEFRPETRERMAELVRARRPRLGKAKYPTSVRDGVEGKPYGTCGVWKPLARFARHATCVGGRRTVCSTCEGRTAYERNPQRCIATVRRYQKRHADAHRVRHRASNLRRYNLARKGGGVTAAFVRELLTKPCVYCGAPADTIDHATPLARGGMHVPENLVPACRKCNFTKKTKTREEFEASRKVEV